MRFIRLFIAAVTLGIGLVPLCARAQAEPSLARILTGRPEQDEVAAQLGEQLADLERRPGARLAAAALADARRALDALRESLADPARERRREIAWAALQRVDREIARAELATALRTLEARAKRAEIEAARAVQSRDAARASQARAEASRAADSRGSAR